MSGLTIFHSQFSILNFPAEPLRPAGDAAARCVATRIETAAVPTLVAKGAHLLLDLKMMTALIREIKIAAIGDTLLKREWL